MSTLTAKFEVLIDKSKGVYEFKKDGKSFSVFNNILLKDISSGHLHSKITLNDFIFSEYEKRENDELVVVGSAQEFENVEDALNYAIKNYELV